MLEGLTAVVEKVALAQAKPNKPVPMLRTLVRRHLTNLEIGKVSPASRATAQATAKIFVELTGDKPIDEVSKQDVSQFCQVLAKLPQYATTKKEFANLTPKEIAARAEANGCKTLEKGTQLKYIKYLSTFFNWCVKSEYITQDPTCEIPYERYLSATGSSKLAFSKADLDALFNPERMDKLTKPHLYWAPQIALYTGLRVNEIAQLYVDNVEEFGGIPCFTINTNCDGQHLKSENAHRPMPIHPRLLELGFMEYVADVKAAGCAHLFPGLNWEGSGPGACISSWFGRYRKKCGILTKDKTFHCFRHSLATWADRSGIYETVITKLLGHSRGTSVARRHYIQQPDVNECIENLGRIQFPEVALQPYVRGRFDTYLRRADKMAERQKLKREKKRKEKNE
ncbi:hypothetical protein BTJ49_03200 [Oleiagrimonas sp. MCCC 1A03011]|nr:hypothetical protein BTJ49_03200 [Oleiagrimonas sp. MCCC 1A03011]